MTKNINTDQLAVMIKHEFDRVDDRFDLLEKGNILIRRDISNLNFLMTESARKEDYILLEKRVGKLESKVGV